VILSLDEHHPRVDPLAFVAPTAVLVGDVEVGPEASVWFGAVLRGDFFPIRVGARTAIQDQVVLHSRAEVGKGCRVAHGAVVHHARVGDGVLVGIGARILDGARVGDGAIVAAGALVPPGMTVPAGHLALGLPARVVRPVTEAERAEHAANTAAYVEMARRYLAPGA